MSARQQSPGGLGVKTAYVLALIAAIFSGMGQMPMTKRYYIADLPGMAWSADFYTLGDLHYAAVAVLLALFAWRLGLAIRGWASGWSWGPRSWWGWSILALLLVTGVVKVLRNAGVFVNPTFLSIMDFTHLFCGMAFMFTALAAAFMPRRQPSVVSTKNV